MFTKVVLTPLPANMFFVIKSVFQRGTGAKIEKFLGQAKKKGKKFGEREVGMYERKGRAYEIGCVVYENRKGQCEADARPMQGRCEADATSTQASGANG